MTAGSPGIATHPYATLSYAASLPHSGEAIFVPEWEMAVLARPIAGDLRDAISPYPLGVLAADADLAGGLDRLRRAGLVSVTLVLADHQRPPLEALAAAFDVVRPFKSHFIADCRIGPLRLGRNHGYKLRRALRKVSVAAVDLGDRLDDWIALYLDHHRHKTRLALAAVNGPELPAVAGLDAWIECYADLVRTHALPPVYLLPRAHHEALATMPGILATGGFIDGSLVSCHLWATDGAVAHSHLVAADAEGLATGATYAVNYVAIREQLSCPVVNLGGIAGTGDRRGEAVKDGLAQFKRGFSNATATACIAGAVLDPERYDCLTAAVTRAGGRHPEGGFFPAYRTPQPLFPTGRFVPSDDH